MGGEEQMGAAIAGAGLGSDGVRRGVRFGLLAIKNVGSRPIEELIEARRSGGPFKSLADVFARTESKNLTRGAVECLIKAGALDSLGRPEGLRPHSWRSRLIQSLDRAMSLGQQQRKMREIGQVSLFGGMADDASDDFVPVEAPDYPQPQLLQWERDLLNLYLSAHPLAHVAPILKKRVTTYTTFLTDEWAGQHIVLGGRVTAVRRIMTKRGDTMAAVQLEDMQGSIEVVVFPKTYAATQEVWREDAVLLVTGMVKMRDDEPQLVCDAAEPFEVTEEESNRREYLVRIRMQRGKNSAMDREQLRDVITALRDFPGEDRYEFVVRNGKWEARLGTVAGQPGVRFCPELVTQIERTLGAGAVEAVALAHALAG
jgi:DNA polymerase-3 subunit alpha